MADFVQQLNQLGDQAQEKINQALVWLNAFFKQIDQLELFAVIAIGLGLLLVIAGIIIL